MSRFLIGNACLLLSMVCAAASQIVIKGLLLEVQTAGWTLATLRSALTAGRAARGGLALSMVVVGFVFWLLALLELNLSYAYPIACSSVLFVALFSALFLGEPVTWRTWSGTVLILVGVILLLPER
jgi:drug/metabolite transporter (DMT)-like permease